MNPKTIFACCFLSTFVLISTSGQISVAPDRRIVLLRGNDLLTAKQDGSDVRVLVKDSLGKADPRWSPDRKKIVYRVAGEKTKNPNTHAKLIVIAVDGSPLRNIPVLATESDGTIVGGMRFVEESGWLSNAELYAIGSVNPRIAEYRIFDANTGSVTGGYLGTGFATCAAKGQVAYVTMERVEPGAEKSRIDVNGTSIYTSSGESINHLQWSSDCDRLAFTESSGAAGRFIVMRGAVREAEIPLRSEMLDSLTIISAEQSFFLQGARDAVYYDVVTRSLRARPDIVNNLNRTRTERERVLRNLGGRSADGWTEGLVAPSTRQQPPPSSRKSACGCYACGVLLAVNFPNKSPDCFGILATDACPAALATMPDKGAAYCGEIKKRSKGGSFAGCAALENYCKSLAQE
ncbi:MAG: hypothetical protein ACT4OT_08140 [Acidobacteriota bacterium]